MTSPGILPPAPIEGAESSVQTAAGTKSPAWSDADRLDALRSYEILDTLPAKPFEDIITLVTIALGVPMAAVNLIDRDRQWSKAERGIDNKETPLAQSICARLQLQPGVTVIPDLADDPRFADDPAVAAPGGIRFYAGAPLLTPQGFQLGMLCAIDVAPRPGGLSAAQNAALTTLADLVMSHLEVHRSEALDRRASVQRRASDNRLTAMFMQATVGLCELSLDGRFIRVNDAHCRFLGRDEANLLRLSVVDVTHPDDLEATVAAVRNVTTSRVPTQVAKRYIRPDGTVLWAEVGMTCLLGADGSPISILAVLTDITARMDSDARLAFSEESLRLSIDAAEIGIWDVVFPSATLTWSDRVRTMFGIHDTEVCTLDDFRAGLHPDDRDATIAAFTQALDPEHRTPYDVEYRTIGRDDGLIRWVAAKGRGLFDAEGTCTRAIGTAIDITTRRKAEQRLRDSEAALAESEAKFRAITDSIDQMVWSTGPDGEYDFFNQRWHDYTGVAPGSIRGDAWSGITHPDDVSRISATWSNSLETGMAYRTEYRLRHRTGQYRWVLARAQPARDPAGRIVHWYGSCTEIEDLVQAREILARSRRELEREIIRRTAERDQVWRATRDLMLVIDFDGVIRDANPAWTDLLGWQPYEVIGSTSDAFLHPDQVAVAAGFQINDVSGTQRPADQLIEARFRHRDGGYRTIAWSIVRQGNVLYASGRDVTDERQAAAALEAAQQQLRQSQKMEAVGQLTGGIAHDFNNMLAVVIGSLDLLGRRLPTDAARERRYVDAAMEGARRAALLTQRLLSFARQQPLQPAPVELNRLVSTMSELLRHSLGAEIRLETVLAEGLWRIHADPNQLENVILNLAVNARDAMAAGGRLTIETHNALLDERYAAEHLGVEPGHYALLAITDTGTGMEPAVIEKAFEPFFTTKDVGRGTGLGLSQVYGFVRQSGGHVKLYSEPGQGTTVKVYFPRLDAEGADTLQDAPSAGMVPPRGEGELVLVVEDEPAVRSLSVEALTDLGYRVLEADGASGALVLIDDNPDIALLFTDIVMPNINGPKLADEVAQRRPDLPVLFTTGYTRNAIIHNGTLTSGVHLISKPFTIEDLAIKVRSVLNAPR